MFYSMECFQPTVYNWCTSLLANMKSQMIDCKMGRKRNFGFASILCIFFFEWVPRLGPRVNIVPHRPRNLAMARWTEVMRQHGGGRVPTPQNDEFLFCWSHQVMALEDYSYARINFRGDPDIPLPPGSIDEDIGMPKFLNISFFVFLYKKTKIFLDDVEY
jgi:hypothetical protein